VNPPINGAVEVSTKLTAVINIPQKEGNYRVHVYVYDPDGSAATVNLPFMADKSVITSSVVLRDTPQKNSLITDIQDNFCKQFSILGQRITVKRENAVQTGKTAAGIYIRGNGKRVLVDRKE
jgi:hypothetical protein